MEELAHSRKTTPLHESLSVFDAEHAGRTVGGLSLY